MMKKSTTELVFTLRILIGNIRMDGLLNIKRKNVNFNLLTGRDV